MLPLYAARIEDLGQGDFVKVDCAGCDHIALLTPEALLRAGLRPTAKDLDLKGPLRCRGRGTQARAVVSMRWRARARHPGRDYHRPRPWGRGNARPGARDRKCLGASASSETGRW